MNVPPLPPNMMAFERSFGGKIVREGLWPARSPDFTPMTFRLYRVFHDFRA